MSDIISPSVYRGIRSAIFAPEASPGIVGSIKFGPGPTGKEAVGLPAHAPVQTRSGGYERSNDMIRKFLKFWPVVEAVASMSKDPSTRVGALALDDSFNIIATGFNGFPRGVNDSLERYEDRDTKLKLVAHAEQNLIAQAAYGGRSLRGATILVSSLYPCSSCAKSIIQSGVRRVISPSPDISPRWENESRWATILFYESSVEVINVKKAHRPDGSYVWEVASP